MSNMITTLCRPLVMSPAQKAVLMCLADSASDDGVVWSRVSVGLVCTWTCLSKASVLRAIQWLEEQGAVKITRPGNGMRSRMVLLLPKLETMDRATNRMVEAATQEENQSHGETGVTVQPVSGCDPTGITVTPEPVSPCNPITYEHKEHRDRAHRSSDRQSADKLPPCPTAQIIEAYHEVLPELPRVRLQTKDRVRAIGQRWAWVLSSKRDDGSRRAETSEEAIQWFRDFFERARCNDFLMGETPRSPEHRNWRCTFDRLLSDWGLKKVIEETVVDE